MNNLKEKWIEYTHTNDKALFEAWEALNDLVFKKPQQAWKVILDILEQTESDEIIGNLAAGPLEDILSEHGDVFIDEVEIQARQNPKFTKLVLGVYQGGMSDNVWSRIQVLQGKYAKS